MTSTAALAVVLSVMALVMARGLWDESAVGIHDDSPHYLLNSVFLTDFVRDHPIGSPMTYARQYFARYPGLTLGHHPLLPPIVEAPFMALFGVSVWSGRFGIICTLLVMLLFWFRLMERMYDTPTAVFSSLLLGTATTVTQMSQTVESEPLALCLIAVALYFLQRYCESERGRDGVVFLAAVVLSAYAKQLAVVVFPVYALRFAMTFGVRRLLSRNALLAAVVVAAGVAPCIVMTLEYSQFNVQIVTTFVNTATRVASHTLFQLARAVTIYQVAWPIAVVALVAAVAGLLRRDRYALLLLFWVASVYVGLAVLGLREVRYACYSAPAMCGLAAAVIHAGRSPRQRQAWMAVLLVVTGYQVAVNAHIRPNGAGGYEEAARFVSEQRVGDSVLYSATEDGGFFVFYVRKHDPKREMILLRADKVLTTSRMFRSDFERVIQRPEEIEPILRRFGVGYVVIEDHPYPDGPLEWLRQLVHGDRFTLRRSIPLTTAEPLLRGVSLGVYEYKGRTPADPDAPLSMKIPLMGDTIAVTFRDLLPNALTQ